MDRGSSYVCVVNQMKARPVLDVELLAGILYTGTEAQGQIRKALREPARNMAPAEGWKWTIIALRHLVMKLAEDPPDRLYHGLNNVNLPPQESLAKSWSFKQRGMSYNNLISGSMSLEM